MACGDIINVKIKENQLIINIDEPLLFDILMEEKNKDLIKQAINWQGLNLEIIVNRIFKQSELIEQDIKKLKNLKINLKIIEGDIYE